MTDYKPDKIQKLPCGSVIQHGRYNDRIYLIKTGKNVSPQLSFELIKLAKKNGYSKIFAKVPARIAKDFINAGFVEEGSVSGLYNDREAGLFLGYFLDPQRKRETFSLEIQKVMELARKKAKQKALFRDLPSNATLRKCNPDDAEEMSEVYKSVYQSYPFAIDDPEYIAETMRGNFTYFCIEVEEKIVALSSVEMFEKSNSVEMTDFATLCDYRGKGFAGRLLKTMESRTRKKRFKTAFTVARAISPGINITFAKSGYTFGGRLRNNTNISGNIESMNIWYKKL